MPVCKIPPRPHPPTTLPFHDDVVKFLAEWFAQPPATCGGRCFFFILEGLKLKKIQTWGVWFENPPRVRNRSLFASTAARVQGGGGRTSKAKHRDVGPGGTRTLSWRGVGQRPSGCRVGLTASFFARPVSGQSRVPEEGANTYRWGLVRGAVFTGVVTSTGTKAPCKVL